VSSCATASPHVYDPVLKRKGLLVLDNGFLVPQSFRLLYKALFPKRVPRC
jgi:hypothetical protein